jgi:hypothetical protein
LRSSELRSFLPRRFRSVSTAEYNRSSSSSWSCLIAAGRFRNKTCRFGAIVSVASRGAGDGEAEANDDGRSRPDDGEKRLGCDDLSFPDIVRMGQHGRAHTPYDSDAGYQCGCELPYRGGWPRRTAAIPAQLIKLPLLLRLNRVPVILISFRNRFLAVARL